DIALRRALGDRAHIDAGVAERAEETTRAAGQSRHSVADHGEDSAVMCDLHALHLTLLELDGEAPLDDTSCRIGGVFAHGEADRVLRAALRNEHHGYGSLAKGTEQAIGRPRDAAHGRGFSVDHSTAVD